MNKKYLFISCSILHFQCYSSFIEHSFHTPSKSLIEIHESDDQLKHSQAMFSRSNSFSMNVADKKLSALTFEHTVQNNSFSDSLVALPQREELYEIQRGQQNSLFDDDDDMALDNSVALPQQAQVSVSHSHAQASVLYAPKSTVVSPILSSTTSQNNSSFNNSLLHDSIVLPQQAEFTQPKIQEQKITLSSLQQAKQDLQDADLGDTALFSPRTMELSPNQQQDFTFHQSANRFDLDDDTYQHENDDDVYNATYTSAASVDPDEREMTMSELASLPTRNRPSNIAQALSNMQQGAEVYRQIRQGNFFDAVMSNIDDDSLLRTHRYASGQEVFLDPGIALLHQVMNGSDQQVWNLIRHLPAMRTKLRKLNVPFTEQNFILPEFNMLFRLTYVRLRIKSKAVLQQYQQAYEKTILQLQWFLYQQAMVEDKAFTSGMITMHDPNYSIFKLLDGYAELLTPGYKLHEGGSLHSLWTTKAYSRISSHWTGQTALAGKQFGIDLQSEDQDEELLPGNKKHILFGIRNNGMIFIKWEDYGTTLNLLDGDFSAVPHTLRYCLKVFGEDDVAYHSREKIARDIKEMFASLYDQALTDQQKHDIDVHGIAAMIRILAEVSQQKAEVFKKYLVDVKKYNKHTLQHRKGAEVILTI